MPALRLLLLGLLLWTAGVQAADFRPGGQPAPGWTVSLITYQPGPVYWERFGHNAILLRDPAIDAAVTFNYGMFDFAQKNFFLNFARGRMLYFVDSGQLDRELPGYAEDGRWALEQSLALTPEQVGWLRDYLLWNVQPRNRAYPYDYFTSNCATRIRDALDGALDGALRRQLQGVMTATTYRDEALRLIAPERLMFVAMDLALGPRADQPLDRWALSFSPLQLMAALRTVTVPAADGHPQPLVRDGQYLLPRASMPDPPAAAPDLGLPCLGLVSLLALALWALHKLRAHRAARLGFALLAALLWLLFGLLGLAMAAIWGLTDHWTGWGNGNLLLFSPAALLLIPGFLRAGTADWRPTRTATLLGGLLAVMALAECGLRLTPWMAQANGHWCLLATPLVLLMAALQCQHYRRPERR